MMKKYEIIVQIYTDTYKNSYIINIKKQISKYILYDYIYVYECVQVEKIKWKCID